MREVTFSDVKKIYSTQQGGEPIPDCLENLTLTELQTNAEAWGVAVSIVIQDKMYQ